MFRGAINLGNPVSNSPLNRGLVSWWMVLPQRMGGTWFDLLNRYHGTLTNGANWYGGARQGSYGSVNFDGSNDKVTFTPAISSLFSNSEGSFAIWAKPTGSSPSVGNSYNGHCLIGDTSRYTGLLRATIGGLDRIWAYNWDGNEDKAGATYTADAWNHLVWVHTGGNLYVYANGVQAASVASGNTSVMSGNPVMGDNGGGSLFAGQLDDARIWNRGLSDSEIWSLYNDSRTGYQQTLNRLPMRVYGTAAAASGVFNPYYYRMLAGHGGLGGAA